MLWSAALCGGVFGLLGGFLIDRFGRKTVMVGQHPAVLPLARWRPRSAPRRGCCSLFRCTTFIGICVEFVAAITWLAELFEDKRSRELAIGWTQAFASVGGLLVTGANALTVRFAADLPALPVRGPVQPARRLAVHAHHRADPRGADPAADAVRPRVAGVAGAEAGRDAAPAELRRAVRPRADPHHPGDDGPVGVRLRRGVRGAAADPGAGRPRAAGRWPSTRSRWPRSARRRTNSTSS